MKPRLAAALLLIAGGSVLWLSTRPGSELVPQSLSEAAPRSTQPVRVNARPAAVAPEGNPEVPEETVTADTNARLPGPVSPNPRPITLAALEESPGVTTNGNDSSLPPATALENMRTVFRHYSQRFGGNPVGSNREITTALGGQNPQQTNFINPDDGARVNGRGELVDYWETPYFFHQLSRTEMEIRSAGPDRRMWTSDDLVLK